MQSCILLMQDHAFSVDMVTKTPACVPDAQWGQTISNRRSLKQAKFHWGRCKEMNGSGHKNTQTPQRPSAKTFSRKEEGGVWIIIADFLVSNRLFLRSRYGQVMMVLNISTKQRLFCSDEKGQGLKAWFYLPKSRSWLRGGRSQLAAPSGPGPHTLPNCHSWGSQVPRTQLPSGSSGPRNGEVQVSHFGS